MKKHDNPYFIPVESAGGYVTAGTGSKLPVIVICSFLAAVTVVCTFFAVRGFVTAEPEQTEPPKPGQTLDIPAEIADYDPVALLATSTDDTTLPVGADARFASLYSLNPYVVGWLRVPNTGIDTPVAQGDDNDDYLRHDLSGKYTEYGNVFLDYRNDIDTLNRNTVLYGHSTMSRQQIFYDLNKYREIDFYKTSPVIEFDTLYSKYYWKVFAVFVTTTAGSSDNGYVFNYIYPDMSDRSFEGFLEQVYQRAFYTTGVDVLPTDKVLTLSTCCYDFGEKVSARLVVMSRLVRVGESLDVDVQAAAENPGYRRPQIWYSSNGKTNPYRKSTTWKPSAS